MHKSVSTWDFISLIGPQSDISVSLLLDMKDFFTVAIWNECEGNYWSLSCYGGRISKSAPGTLGRNYEGFLCSFAACSIWLRVL